MKTLHSERMRLLAMEGKWSAAMHNTPPAAATCRNSWDWNPPPRQLPWWSKSAGTPPATSPCRCASCNRRLICRVFTPFTGRERELEVIAAAIAQPHCRMLTLLGPGGIGKNRLAVEAARDKLEFSRMEFS
jgi:hypothetical protein